jgi:hypothetical protein
MKNLIEWITKANHNKSLSLGGFSLDKNINAKSIKLSKNQITKLNKLLEEKNKLESGVLLCNDEINAELYWKEPSGVQYYSEEYYLEEFVVPIGTKASGVTFGGDGNIDVREFAVKKLNVVKQTKAAEIIIAMCHGNCESDILLKCCEKDIHNWYQKVEALHNEFVKFFWEIKLPCWVDWYFEDTETKILHPIFDFEEEEPYDCWAIFDTDLLNKALKLLAEGEEVIFENVEPYKETVLI